MFEQETVMTPGCQNNPGYQLYFGLMKHQPFYLLLLHSAIPPTTISCPKHRNHRFTLPGKSCESGDVWLAAPLTSLHPHIGISQLRKDNFKYSLELDGFCFVTKRLSSCRIQTVSRLASSTRYTKSNLTSGVSSET